MELRTYRAVPGRLGALVERMTKVLPLLADAGISVVTLAPSVVDDEGEHAVLVRSFDSLDRREVQEEEFYGGAVWRDGPRDGVLELIESYHTVVLDIGDHVTAAQLTAVLTPNHN